MPCCLLAVCSGIDAVGSLGRCTGDQGRGLSLSAAVWSCADWATVDSMRLLCWVRTRRDADALAMRVNLARPHPYSVGSAVLLQVRGKCVGAGGKDKSMNWSAVGAAATAWAHGQ